MNATDQPPMELPAEYVQASLSAVQAESPKITGPVADAPLTIEVIPPEVYEAQGATTLSDVLRNTPGITFFAGEGGSANRTGGDSFYLRGFDTSNSIFVDGVREEGAVQHDTFDLGQVDVFKGPSPENGRGGTAGYIDLETKLPTRTEAGEVDCTRGFGADGSLASDRETIDIDQPFGPTDAVRLNLLDQEGGVPGRQYAENNRWGVAPSLAFGLGMSTRLFLTEEHLYAHNLPDYGVPSTILPGFAPPPSASVPSLYSPGVNPSTYYGFVDFDREHVTDDAAALRVERDFGPGLTFGNQLRDDIDTRFVEATSPQGNATTPVGEATLSQGIYDTKNENLSDQANLSGSFDTGQLSHTPTTGLEASRETADNPIWVVVPNGTPTPPYLVSLYSPDNFTVALAAYDPHPTGSTTDTRINTVAWYGFDTVALNRFWQLVAGLRLEHYNINELSVTAASAAVPAFAGAPATATTPATAATSAVAAVPASTVDLSAGQTTASWRTGLVFKPRENITLYLSYATSSRPPGTSTSTNTLSINATSADNPLLEPEKAVNYEAGVKWQLLGDGLLATAAVFRSVNTNVPATDPVSGLVNQTSAQTVRGGELGLSGKLTDRWLVHAGYSHLEPQVSNEISTNAQGLTLPLLPKDSGNLWTTYALPRGITIGGGVQYMGATDRLQATTAPTAATFADGVPSYWVCTGMVSWDLSQHFTLRLNANNLADREYVASLDNNGYRLNLGAPRSFLLTAIWKW